MADKSWAEKKQEMARRAARVLVGRTGRLMKRFGDQPYNSPKLSMDERREAYGLVREDVEYLAADHARWQKKHHLPEDELCEPWWDQLMRAEADWREWQRGEPAGPRPAPVPAGYHVMEDGTVMRDAEMTPSPAGEMAGPEVY